MKSKGFLTINLMTNYLSLRTCDGDYLPDTGFAEILISVFVARGIVGRDNVFVLGSAFFGYYRVVDKLSLPVRYPLRGRGARTAAAIAEFVTLPGGGRATHHRVLKRKKESNKQN